MQFEYKVEIISRYDNSTYQVIHEIAALNTLGVDGWELVSSAVIGQLVYGYFKRTSQPSD